MMTECQSFCTHFVAFFSRPSEMGSGDENLCTHASKKTASTPLRGGTWNTTWNKGIRNKIAFVPPLFHPVFHFCFVNADPMQASHCCNNSPNKTQLIKKQLEKRGSTRGMWDKNLESWIKSGFRSTSYFHGESGIVPKIRNSLLFQPVFQLYKATKARFMLCILRQYHS